MSSWGLLTRDGHRIAALNDRSRLPQVLRTSSRPGLVFGNGRSYGDVCLNPGGTLWTTRGLDRFIAFDAEAGVLECEAGVLIKDIIDIVLPRGWFPPVVPGTQFVTVGGAIANDVHGKGQHLTGNFGDHALGFELVRTDGTVRWCTPDENLQWFRATIGGLGLTGVITRARLRLTRIPGPWLDTRTSPFHCLEDFFELSAEAAHRSAYAVAWVDCAAGPRGRGVFFEGNHGSRPDTMPVRRPRSVPLTPPFSIINSLTLRAFNSVYFNRHRLGENRGSRVESRHYLPFFFPLDNLLQWNRLYGSRGFYQYQSVVPIGSQLEATRSMLKAIARAGLGSFLAVLKTFGDRPAKGLLSFTRAGTSLALDFPNQGIRTLALFKELDAIVRDAGGRLYPAKDARMPREMFEQGYPYLGSFLPFLDAGISSAMSRRLLAH